jgi:hypothetical protein
VQLRQKIIQIISSSKKNTAGLGNKIKFWMSVKKMQSILKTAIHLRTAVAAEAHLAKGD